ncbi:MAG TPA: hypothetical protein VLX61_16190 [Anaerolineales bacterium]|nr:hypothetical protein [Anaerolineales bacterium]
MTRASLKSSPELSRRDLIILALAVGVGAGAYLLASALIYGIGFPLDDSWIHQTYARNLALYGQWAFQLGHPSAGSTAPAWTFILAIGFWLHLSPYVWTYFIGGLTLLGVGLVMELAARKLLSAYRPSIPWVGLFFVAEWHFLWAAMSGMETLLDALLLSSVLVLLMTGSPRYLAMGLLTGLSVWVRPDGLTLLAPVLLTILLMNLSIRDKFNSMIRYLIGFGSLFVPYLLFNLWLSGTPMPNTFYAKQTEYAFWQTEPFLYHVGVLFVQVFTGPGIILLPGIIGWAVLAIRRRDWASLASMLWCGGYLYLYISRLPAYQHGRYLMPAMPILFLFGMLAFLEFAKSHLLNRYHWTVQQIWQVSLVLVTLGFVALGARAYGEDVGLIESEMVVTAQWVARNIPPHAIIAAHDIGALGYFDNHRLIDLAGLVSPEVIPFMRDQPRLAAYLNQRGANYLIAFPDFYPDLTRNAPVVFSSGGRFAIEAGQQNMAVYRWVLP